MPTAGEQKRPHVALLPSAGMGHLAPFCRLAAALSDRGCRVTFIPAQPTVSHAESDRIRRLLDSFPTIQSLNLPLTDLDDEAGTPTVDPFFLRFESIRRSAALLPSLLASAGSTPPVSALVIDIMSACTFVPVAKQLNLPSYILFTSSAAFLALFTHFPVYNSDANPSGPIADIDVPGFRTVPKASVPPPLHDPTHIFAIPFLANGRMLPEADGILLNTFEALEPEAMDALKGRRVVPILPPVFAIGPFRNSPRKNDSTVRQWLDRQQDRSVVFVSFGSRTAMSAEQIREVGCGLERCGKRFLWVVKTKKVDREEDDEGGRDLEAMLGEGYVERVRERGVVVVGRWIEQEEVLNHPAVGGFVSHCGWNSVTEAAMAGVRVLGWPRIGDQRVNGEVVRRSGLGVWMEGWSWEGEEGVVGGEEIAERVKEMMEDEGLRVSAERVGEEARKAVGPGGSSDGAWREFIGRLMV